MRLAMKIQFKNKEKPVFFCSTSITFPKEPFPSNFNGIKSSTLNLLL